jgi:hypothetical protein
MWNRPRRPGNRSPFRARMAGGGEGARQRMRPISNPPNPWLSTQVEYLDEPQAVELQVYEEQARSALSENDSPDLGFRYSVNPYRGCQHACSTLRAPVAPVSGFRAGPISSRIVVNSTCEVLALARAAVVAAERSCSGNTDCWPLEASYVPTRRCLRCVSRGAPVGDPRAAGAAMSTRCEARPRPGASVQVSILLDERRAPGRRAPAPRALRTLRLLSEAGDRDGRAPRRSCRDSTRRRRRDPGGRVVAGARRVLTLVALAGGGAARVRDGSAFPSAPRSTVEGR